MKNKMIKAPSGAAYPGVPDYAAPTGLKNYLRMVIYKYVAPLALDMARTPNKFI
jgi:hypothetical protein